MRTREVNKVRKIKRKRKTEGRLVNTETWRNIERKTGRERPREKNLAK